MCLLLILGDLLGVHELVIMPVLYFKAAEAKALLNTGVAPGGACILPCKLFFVDDASSKICLVVFCPCSLGNVYSSQPSI